MKMKWFYLAVLVVCKSGWSATQGYVLLSSRWEATDIPVCWESGNYTTEKEWVKQKIASTWSSVSTIRFTGWVDCPQPASYTTYFYRSIQIASTFSGIRILIMDGGPHTKSLGNNIAGVVDGMMLNFTFKNWSTSCASSKKYCIENIAVHEFGHALGIAHEQNRPDTPPCDDQPQGTSGNALIGDWDASSVMNYCNPIWGNDGFLSSGDLETINFLYPFKLGPPKNPIPINYGKVFSASTQLRWAAADPYFSENITYDVYYGLTNPPTMVAVSNTSATSVKVSGLAQNKTYYWKVNAKRTQTYVRESGFSGILWTSLFATYSQTQTHTNTEEAGTVWKFETKPNMVPILALLQ